MAIPNNPITRKETFLAKAAGQDVSLPENTLTREEAYLRAIAEGGGGGGGSTTAESVSYDNTDSGLQATNVQDAIDEVAELVPKGEHSPYVYKEGSETYADILKSVFDSIDPNKLNTNSKLIYEDVTSTYNHISIFSIYRIGYSGGKFVKLEAGQILSGGSDVTRFAMAAISKSGEAYIIRVNQLNMQSNGTFTHQSQENISFAWNRAYILY